MVFKLNVNSVGVVAASFLMLCCSQNDVHGMKKKGPDDAKAHYGPKKIQDLKKQRDCATALSKEATTLAVRIVKEVKKKGSTILSQETVGALEEFFGKLNSKRMPLRYLVGANIFVLDLLSLLSFMTGGRSLSDVESKYMKSRVELLIEKMSRHYEETTGNKAGKKWENLKTEWKETDLETDGDDESSSSYGSDDSESSSSYENDDDDDDDDGDSGSHYGVKNTDEKKKYSKNYDKGGAGKYGKFKDQAWKNKGGGKGGNNERQNQGKGKNVHQWKWDKKKLPPKK